MRGWVASALITLVLFGLSGGTALALTSTPGPTPEHDKDLVFCLSTDNRPKLAEAAVILGLAKETRGDRIVVGASQLELPQWEKQSRDHFTRACAALRAATPDMSPPSETSALATTLGVLLPVVAGALLTLFTTEWRNAANTGARYSDNLSDALITYEDAVLAYIAIRSADQPAPTDALARAQNELEKQLRQIKDYKRRWTTPGNLISIADQKLSSEEINHRVVTESADVHAVLGSFSAEVRQLGTALRRPWLPHPAMRRAPGKKRDTQENSTEQNREKN